MCNVSIRVKNFNMTALTITINKSLCIYYVLFMPVPDIDLRNYCAYSSALTLLGRRWILVVIEFFFFFALH